MEKFNTEKNSPTCFDSEENYMGSGFEDNLFCLMTITRDSCVLEESNWACALKMLGGESDSVQIFRIGHWTCGWIDYLCIVEGSDQETVADDIERALADYPVLDDEDFSRREEVAAEEVWRSCFGPQGRIEYIRKFRDQFDFRNWEDMMSVVRGRYFSGYASELLY